MRISRRWIVCILLLGSTARAQTLASRVPDDAIAYLGWAGADSPGNGYSGSRLEAIIQSSNLPALGDEFLPQVLSKITARNGDNGDGARFLQTLLSILCRHPSAIYFSGMTSSPDGAPLPKMGILCQAGEDTETLNSILNAATQNSPARNLIRVIQSGDVIALTSGYSEDEMPLANDPQQIGEVANRAKTLESNSDFGRSIKEVSGNGLITGYLDAGRFLSVIDQVVQAGDNDQAKDMWPKLRDVSGLLGLKRIAFTAGFEGRDWAMQAFVDAPSPRRGLLTVIEPKPIDHELLDRVPSTAVFAQVIPFDVGALVRQIRKGMGATLPLGGMLFDRGVGFLQLFIGRNPRTDIIDPLGNDWAIYNDSSLSDKPMLNTIIVNKLIKPDKASAGWNALWVAAENVGGPFIRKKNLPMSLTQSTVGDLTIHTVQMPLVDPSWTIHGGYLYFGLSPNTVAAAANWMGAGFSGNSIFDSLEKKLVGDAVPGGFSFTNLPETAAATYPQLQAAIDKAGDLLSAQDLHLPEKLLPPLEKIMPELTPALRVSWADDAGLHFKAVGPFPGAELLSPRPVIGASGVNESVLSSLFLGPAIQHAKNVAGMAASTENMKQIGRAVLLYAAKNNGKCPPDLATLVSQNLLKNESTTLPGGEAYIYMASGIDISTVADASKTIILHDPDDATVDGKYQVLFLDGHVDTVQTTDSSAVAR